MVLNATRFGRRFVTSWPPPIRTKRQLRPTIGQARVPVTELPNLGARKSSVRVRLSLGRLPKRARQDVVIRAGFGPRSDFVVAAAGPVVRDTRRTQRPTVLMRTRFIL